MLTVIRITAPPDRVKDLDRVIGAIDARHASGDVEPRSFRNDGYFVSFPEQPSWAENASAILHFVEDNQDALALARAAGAVLDLDIGVEPEDVVGMAFLEMVFPGELLELLSASSVKLIVTLYCTRDADDAGD